jgi:hypothetical protein
MTGQEILNQAANIIKRQDLDRTLLLFFVNTVRRAVLRDKKVKRFYKYQTNVTHSSGVIDMTAQKIKNPRKVEWQYVDAGATKQVLLAEVYSYQQAMDLYSSLTATGSPTGYLELGTSMYILPVLTTGQINIYGEFWLDDIADTALSNDITTVEIPDALIYLGAAEYFDYLQEADKAGYWRKKGLALVDAYIAQWNAQEFDTTDAWRRQPFGRHITQRRKATTNDLEKGKW